MRGGFPWVPRRAFSVKGATSDMGHIEVSTEIPPLLSGRERKGDFKEAVSLMAFTRIRGNRRVSELANEFFDTASCRNAPRKGGAEVPNKRRGASVESENTHPTSSETLRRRRWGQVEGGIPDDETPLLSHESTRLSRARPHHWTHQQAGPSVMAK